MIGRYTRSEMGNIWSEAAQYAAWLEGELAAAAAMVELGSIPADALEEVRRAVPPDPERVAEIEARTKHDVIAFLEAIEEQEALTQAYQGTLARRNELADRVLFIYRHQGIA